MDIQLYLFADAINIFPFPPGFLCHKRTSNECTVVTKTLIKQTLERTILLQFISNRDSQMYFTFEDANAGLILCQCLLVFLLPLWAETVKESNLFPG